MNLSPLLAISALEIVVKKISPVLTAALIAVTLLRLVYLLKSRRNNTVIADAHNGAQPIVTVVLVELGNNPLHVIKTIRKYSSVSLAAAHEITQLQLPATILVDMPADKARMLQQELAHNKAKVDLIVHE